MVAPPKSLLLYNYDSIHAVKPLGQGQVLLVQPALSLLYMYSSVENNSNGTCGVNHCVDYSGNRLIQTPLGP